MNGHETFRRTAALLLDRAETHLLHRRSGLAAESLSRLFVLLARDATAARLPTIALVADRSALLVRQAATDGRMTQEVEDLLLDAVDEMREVVEGGADEDSGIMLGLGRRLGSATASV